MLRKTVLIGCLVLLAILSSIGCKQGSAGQASAATQTKETKVGLASFYGQAFQGQETASGKIFNKNELVAAHPSYPTGTKVRVTNLANDQAVEVRVIDRGPSQENQAEGVIIDLSKEAANKLDMIKEGRTRVRTEVIEWGDNERKEPTAN